MSYLPHRSPSGYLSSAPQRSLHVSSPRLGRTPDHIDGRLNRSGCASRASEFCGGRCRSPPPGVERASSNAAAMLQWRREAGDEQEGAAHCVQGAYAAGSFSRPNEGEMRRMVTSYSAASWNSTAVLLPCGGRCLRRSR